MFDDLKRDAVAHGFEDVSSLRLVKLVLLYPAMRMLFWFRLIQSIKGRNKVSIFFKRLLWISLCRSSGCHLYFDAVIEPGVCFPHPTGIVIGKGCVVKNGVTVFQNVTLGAPSVQNDSVFPVIESGAVIYAGAVIVGDITVGKDAIVAANAVVTQDVKTGTTVGGVPAKLLT